MAPRSFSKPCLWRTRKDTVLAGLHAGMHRPKALLVVLQVSLVSDIQFPDFDLDLEDVGAI